MDPKSSFWDNTWGYLGGYIKEKSENERATPVCAVCVGAAPLIVLIPVDSSKYKKVIFFVARVRHHTPTKPQTKAVSHVSRPRPGSREGVAGDIPNRDTSVKTSCTGHPHRPRKSVPLRVCAVWRGRAPVRVLRGERSLKCAR
jgi:hypothetical protein